MSLSSQRTASIFGVHGQLANSTCPQKTVASPFDVKNSHLHAMYYIILYLTVDQCRVHRNLAESDILRIKYDLFLNYILLII